MTRTSTDHLYIEKVQEILSGEPVIKGTRTPVRAIVENWRMGIPPEEIPSHLPHLSLAQVFDALSYFADHTDEINQHNLRNRIADELLDRRFQGRVSRRFIRLTLTRTWMCSSQHCCAFTASMS